MSINHELMLGIMRVSWYECNYDFAFESGILFRGGGGERDLLS